MPSPSFAERPSSPRRPPASAPTPHRRLSPRVDVELDVAVRTRSASFTGFSANVSEGGIFVGWHAFGGPAPGPNERFEVEFTLPGGRQPIAATAEVRWEQRGCPKGIGAEFVDMPPRCRAELEAFVAVRAPLCYGP